MPVLLVSVALLGCSGDKKGGDRKGGGGGDSKKGDGEPAAGEMKPVKVGSATLSGTVTLDKGVDLKKRVEALEAGLKEKIDKEPKYKNVCERAYKQTSWLWDKDTRGVQNVVVWIMPEKDEQFFDVKDLAEKKKGFDPVVVLDQPHCQFEPRVLVLFPDYIDPSKPKTEDGDINYVKSGQKFYAINPTTTEHNTKLSVPSGGGKDASRVVPKETTKKNPEKGFDLTEAAKLQPYDISKGPIHIACDIHSWMSGSAWALPHPLAAVTDEKGKYEIKNVPDSGKVRFFVWHEQTGFINDGGSQGQVIDLKDLKQDIKISADKVK